MSENVTDTRDKLREEILRVQIESLKLAMEQMRVRLDNRIDAIENEHKEHNTRLRAVEETAIKFNFILYLSMGGGLVGVINLAVLLLRP